MSSPDLLQTALRLGYLENTRRVLLKLNMPLERYAKTFGRANPPDRLGLSWDEVKGWLDANPEGPPVDEATAALHALREALKAVEPLAKVWGGPGWGEKVDEASDEDVAQFVAQMDPFAPYMNAYVGLLPQETARMMSPLIFLGAAYDAAGRRLGR